MTTVQSTASDRIRSIGTSEIPFQANSAASQQRQRSESEGRPRAGCPSAQSARLTRTDLSSATTSAHTAHLERETHHFKHQRDALLPSE
jgi:hypothetical protein